MRSRWARSYQELWFHRDQYFKLNFTEDGIYFISLDWDRREFNDRAGGYYKYEWYLTKSTGKYKGFLVVEVKNGIPKILNLDKRGQQIQGYYNFLDESNYLREIQRWHVMEKDGGMFNEYRSIYEIFLTKGLQIDKNTNDLRIVNVSWRNWHDGPGSDNDFYYNRLNSFKVYKIK